MTGPHGRPTAAELIEAAREWIESLESAGRGPSRFELRVAANALRIAERELAAPAATTASVRLGFRDDHDLAAAIRAGTVALTDQVRNELLIDVEARLAVANPAYTVDYRADEDGP
jgi:hypothetical protein